MADYQRIVEYLRDVRSAPPAQPTEELRNYANQYAELCVQANERLRQCSGFLAKGLRTEAIHLAEETPNLLDLVAALDMPDPESWNEYCRNHDLPIAQSLQLDRAAQLNEAYAADQPLEALLGQHRLLALARAPVGRRLGVLRQIAALDSGSAFWEQDIRTFERARLRELPEVFYNAVKSKDFETLNALYSEVVETPWQEPMPADLRTGVTEAFARIRQSRVEAQLRGQLAQLQAAYSAGDLATCVDLIKQWKDTMDLSGVTGISAELAEQITPITTWVKQQGDIQLQQKKIAAAMEGLRRTLEAGGTDEQIASAANRVKALHADVPEELMQQWETLRATRTAAAARKRRSTLIGVAVTASVLIVVAVVIVMLINRSRGAAAWAASIRTANNQHTAAGLASAEQAISELQKNAPQLATDASVAAAISDTHAMRRQFDADTQTIQRALADFPGELDKARQATGGNDPRNLLAAAAEADGFLATHAGGADLTWADTQSKLAAARTELSGVRDQLRQAASKAVADRLAALSQQLQSATDDANGAAQLAVVVGEARALTDLAGLDDANHKAAANLASAAEQRRQMLAQGRQERQDYLDLPNHTASVGQYLRTLDDFLAKYPEGTVAPDIRAAAALAKSAQAMDEWRAMTDRWAGPRNGAVPVSIAVPPSAIVAQQRLADFQAFAKAHDGSPFLKLVSDYGTYLTHASEALADQGTWQQAFKDILDKQMVTDLAFMETSDGKRYWVLGDIKRAERRINEQVTVTFEALDPTNFAKRQIISVEPPKKLVTDKPVPAPHAVFANDLADRLKTIDEHNWDTFGIDMAYRLAKATDAELVIRAILLQVALTTEEQVAAPFLGDVYDKTVRDLARQEVEKIVWYDPARPVTQGTKQALTAIFDELPKSDDVRKQLAATHGALFRWVDFSSYATGVLLKDSKGQWTVAGATPRSDGDIAWAWGPGPAASDDVKMIPIARGAGGVFVLDAAAMARLPQGTMVFVTRP